MLRPQKAIRKTDKVQTEALDVAELTAEGLKDELLKYGVDAGPIVGKNVHRNKCSSTSACYVYNCRNNLCYTKWTQCQLYWTSNPLLAQVWQTLSIALALTINPFLLTSCWPLNPSYWANWPSSTPHPNGWALTMRLGVLSINPPGLREEASEAVGRERLSGLARPPPRPARDGGQPQRTRWPRPIQR